MNEIRSNFALYSVRGCSQDRSFPLYLYSVSGPLSVQVCMRIITVLFIAVLCAVSSVFAQSGYTKFSNEQLEQLIHSKKHLVVSLAGEWTRQHKGQDEQWTKVYLPRSERQAGVFVYKKTFRMNAADMENRTWQLYCLGSNYRTEVRINGQYVGNHIGGTTPFSMRIREPLLKNGDNVIELTVDNELNASSTIPLRREVFGAQTGGGVYRELFLVGTPHIWVSELSLKTAFSSGYSRCDLGVSATVSSGDIRRLLVPSDTNGTMKPLAIGKTSVTVEAELRDIQSGSVVARSAPVSIDIEANRNTNARFSMAIESPRLWSPANPNLYTLSVVVRKDGQSIDEYFVPAGLYDISKSADGRTVRLNGEAFRWKSVEYVEDLGKAGQTLDAADFERDAIALKTLGVNVVRIRHSSPHPYFAYLCSKYGLFVMPELPVSQVPQSILGSENIIATAQNTMQEMLATYDWMPCLLAWGISDGATEGTAEMRRYSQRLVNVVRASSSRLIYKVVPGASESIDPTGFDFLCFSFNDDDMAFFRQQTSALTKSAGGKPVIFSFGRIVQPNNNAGYSHPLSIEAQAKYLRDRFVYLQESSIGEGCVIWSFNDYGTERPILIANNSDQYTCTSGLTTRSRDVRLSYNVVKALFNDEKELVITAGTYQEDAPYIYTIMSIVLIILFFVLINSSRRFRENVGRALLRPYNFYADIRDQRILSNVRTVILALILSGTLGMMLSSLLYHLRKAYELDFALAHLFPANGMKEFVDMIVWMPVASTIAATVVFMLLFVGIAALIRLGSLFVRSRIFFTDAFIISVWAALPIIFLLLLTMGLYRILELGSYTTFSFLLIVGVLLWFLYRVLRGTAVIYDVWSPQVYAIGLALIMVAFTVIGLMYDSSYSSFAYMQYFFSTIYR